MPATIYIGGRVGWDDILTVCAGEHCRRLTVTGIMLANNDLFGYRSPSIRAWPSLMDGDLALGGRMPATIYNVETWCQSATHLPVAVALAESRRRPWGIYMRANKSILVDAGRVRQRFNVTWPRASGLVLTTE